MDFARSAQRRRMCVPTLHRLPAMHINTHTHSDSLVRSKVPPPPPPPPTGEAISFVTERVHIGVKYLEGDELRIVRLQSEVSYPSPLQILYFCIHCPGNDSAVTCVCVRHALFCFLCALNITTGICHT